MNTKTKKYVLPAFVAAFALMFVAATPSYVIAEPGEGKEWGSDSDGAYDHSKKKNMNKGHHMAVEVEGFTGSIAIPEMSEETDKKAAHDVLKEQVTVKLSEAASAAESARLDVIKGSIGMAVNENGDKFVVWTLAEMNKDSESETMSATIFVVDAADVTNTTQVTKEFDRSMMMIEDKDKGYSHDKGDYENTLSDPEQIQNKIAKIEEKLSEGGTGNAETDDLKSQFLNVLKQLQTAITNGDDAQADSLREQLNDLRSQMTDMKRHR